MRLVKIKVAGEEYSVPGPARPIPAGLEDCFGQFRDMDVPVCQTCDVNEFCGAVMDIRIQEAELREKEMRKLRKNAHERSRKD